MKNIHILTTSKPSRLLNCIEGFRLFEEEVSPDNEWCVNVNIHITSDEEIKEEDYWYDNLLETVNKGNLVGIQRSKKIILTTDQDLIKDGVQAIDDEFLQWFVKNPSCEEVEVDDRLLEKCYTYYRKNILKNKNLYKIIIPKEEPKKVLTEEDIFNQKDIDAVTDYINKEQQKQHLIDMMKSDEELGLYDEKIEDIELEEVRGSIHCQFSVVENKLAIIYRNQLKILQAIKMLNNER
jgi:hypothetical protein